MTLLPTLTSALSRISTSALRICCISTLLVFAQVSSANAGPVIRITPANIQLFKKVVPKLYCYLGRAAGGKNVLGKLRAKPRAGAKFVSYKRSEIGTLRAALKRRVSAAKSLYLQAKASGSKSAKSLRKSWKAAAGAAMAFNAGVKWCQKFELPDPYEAATLPTLANIQPHITVPRTSGEIPFVVHVSAMDTAAAGSGHPYDELEFRWDFGDREGNEIFVHPVGDRRGMNANTDQKGPEAAYVYRRPGNYRVTLRARGWTGSKYITASTSINITVQPWSGADRYFDPVDGNDSNDGASPGSAWKSWNKFKEWLSGATGKRAFLKRGTILWADNQFSFSGSRIRVQPYGTGPAPVIKAAPLFNLTYDEAMLYLNASGDQSDHVYEGILLDGHNGRAPSTFVLMTWGGGLNDLAFLDVRFVNHAGSSLIYTTGRGANQERLAFWNCQFEHGRGGGQGLGIFSATRWLAVVGGSFTGGEGDLIRDHHIYPSGMDNMLFRWIKFGQAYSKNFCINTNARDDGAFTEHVLIDGVNCTGTMNGLDMSNSSNNTSGEFNDVILQSSAVHDTGTIGSQSYALLGYSVRRYTIRHNHFYKNRWGDISVSDPNADLLIYGNKFYTERATSFDPPEGETGRLTDNIFFSVHNGTAGYRPIRYDLGSARFTIDGNRHWYPNLTQPFYNTALKRFATFAEWQAAGHDVHGGYADPAWTDPDNGDFSSASDFVPAWHALVAIADSGGAVTPKGITYAATGTSQRYDVTPLRGFKIGEVFIDGVSVGDPSSYTFKNVRAPHSIRVSFTPASPPLGVDAGPDRTIVVSEEVNLQAEILNAGPSAVINWMSLRGPGAVTFSDPQNLRTTASFSHPGVYALSAVVTEYGRIASDDVKITVQPEPAAAVPAGPADPSYSGFSASALSSIQPHITIPRTSGEIPFVVHASAMETTAMGAKSPYDELEYSWDFGDGAGTETFTHPLSGAQVNANTDQKGPEAAYVYRRPGTYTVRLSVRGWTGSVFVNASTTATVTADAWAGETRYFDPALGSDAQNGMSDSTPWASWSKLTDWLKQGSGRRALLKSGSVFTAVSPMQFSTSRIRVGTYGESQEPAILRADPAFSGTALVELWANYGHQRNVVFDNIVLDCLPSAAATRVVYSYFNSSGSLEDIAFIRTAFWNTAGSGLVVYTGDRVAERLAFWGCRFEHGTSAGQGLGIFGGKQWLAVVGGSFAGGNGDMIRDHHIYPSEIDNMLFRWIQFGQATSKNFCINTNCSGTGGFTRYVLMDGIDCTGTQNSLDWSNGNNNPNRGRFDHGILQNSAIHHAGSIGNQGSGIFGYSVSRLTIRDNLFYNNRVDDIVISDAQAQLMIYRNRFYKPEDATGTPFIAGGMQSGVFADNVIVHLGKERFGRGGVTVQLPFSLAAYWFIDRNQYWTPNMLQNSVVKPFQNRDDGSSKTFAEWQAAGFDPHGFVANPSWADPSNGDFSSP